MPPEHLGEVPTRTAPDLEDGHAFRRNLGKEGLDEEPTLVPIVGGVITCHEPTVLASPCSFVGDLGPVLVRLVLGHATPPSRSSSTASLEGTIYVSRVPMPTAETSTGRPRPDPTTTASPTRARRRSRRAIVIRVSRCSYSNTQSARRPRPVDRVVSATDVPGVTPGMTPRPILTQVHRPNDAGRTGPRTLEPDVHVHLSPVHRPVMTAWPGSLSGATMRPGW